MMKDALEVSKVKPNWKETQSVVGALVATLTTDACLKSFVFRINEDLRRGESRISKEIESQYFAVLAKILSFNRLKLQSMKDFTNDWKPEFINVIDALDRMSFARVIFSVEKSLEGESNELGQLSALKLYTEMVSYLRLLVESPVEGHKDIAVSQLHRLFYAATEHKDPLPKLVHSWKPGVHSKEYIQQLIQLVHETLSTLQKARSVFEANMSYLKEASRKSKHRQADGDLEQYVLGCLRFDVDEYFSRIFSHNTVSMYMKVLGSIGDYDSFVVDILSAWFERILAYKIREASSEVYAGFQIFLFNIENFLIFQVFLDRYQVTTDQKIHTLVKYVEIIINSFATLAASNRMLFVEALFVPPRPGDHCLQMQTVYHAMDYIRNHVYLQDVHDDSEVMVEDDMKSLSTELGDEFVSEALFSRPINQTTRRRISKSKKLKVLVAEEPNLLSTSSPEDENLTMQVVLPWESNQSNFESRLKELEDTDLEKNINNGEQGLRKKLIKRKRLIDEHSDDEIDFDNAASTGKLSLDE
jgi:hypothetical protein